MSTKKPAFEQRRNAVDTRHDHMGWISARGDVGRLSVAAVLGQVIVTAPAVSEHDGPRFNGVAHERNQAGTLPDVALVIDCTNCGDAKLAMIGRHNDFCSDLLPSSRRNRVLFSDLKANDVVMGTEDKLIAAARKLAGDVSPTLLMLAQSSMVRLIGTDVAAIAADLEQELGIGVAVVPTATMSGDFLGGYDAALTVVADRVELDGAAGAADAGAPPAVVVVGNLFERHEADQRANIGELRRMLASLSLEVPSLWLDGTPFSELRLPQVPIVSLPYAPGASARLQERLGVERYEVPVPIGLDGSAEWLRRIAAHWGRADAAEATIMRELDEIVPRLEIAVRRNLMGRRAAVVADPHIAPPLCAFLAELGIEVSGVAVHARNADAATPVRAVVQTVVTAPEVISDPTVATLEALFSQLVAANRLDIIIGTSRARDVAKAFAVPYLELGFPCYVRHALFDAPLYGFRGAVWLADAIFNRLNEWEYQNSEERGPLRWRRDRSSASPVVAQLSPPRPECPRCGPLPRRRHHRC